MLQLEGTILLGGVDYSDEITSLLITRRRNLVARPATFGNSRETQKAGTLTEELTINFINGTAAALVWAELWDAIDTDSAELTFSGTLTDAAIGADNPAFTGTCIVTGVSVGGQVGQYNQQTWTFPITEAGIVRDTTP